MNGHTDRTNRLLSLWLDLQTAFGKTSRPRVVPWECQNPEVARLWAQITEPANQRALEEWLYQIAPGQMELWAQQALGECRRRREKPVED